MEPAKMVARAAVALHHAAGRPPADHHQMQELLTALTRTTRALAAVMASAEAAPAAGARMRLDLARAYDAAVEVERHLANSATRAPESLWRPRATPQHLTEGR